MNTITSEQYVRFDTVSTDTLPNGNKIEPEIGIRIYICGLDSAGKYEEEYISFLKDTTLIRFLDNIERIENAKQP